MKKVLLFFLASAAALAIAPAAKADTFTFTYVGNGDGVSATGELWGNWDSSLNAYLLTGGDITVTGAPACPSCTPATLNTTGSLVTDLSTVAHVGGGTQLFGQDNLLFPSLDPQLDPNGIVFQFGPDSGIGISGKGAQTYGAFGGNWNLSDTGVFEATATPTPEPGSLVLLGSGILGLAMIVFRSAKRSTVAMPL